MGYSISLIDKETGDVATSLIPLRHRGSNVIVDGEALKRGEVIQLHRSDLRIDVTSNYHQHFVEALGEGGIRQIDGKTAKESMFRLVEGICKLHGPPEDDYWAVTPGNARDALLNLFEMAINAPPDSVWSISY